MLDYVSLRIHTNKTKLIRMFSRKALTAMSAFLHFLILVWWFQTYYLCLATCKKRSLTYCHTPSKNFFSQTVPAASVASLKTLHLKFITYSFCPTHFKTQRMCNFQLNFYQISRRSRPLLYLMLIIYVQFPVIRVKKVMQVSHVMQQQLWTLNYDLWTKILLTTYNLKILFHEFCFEPQNHRRLVHFSLW